MGVAMEMTSRDKQEKEEPVERYLSTVKLSISTLTIKYVLVGVDTTFRSYIVKRLFQYRFKEIRLGFCSRPII